MAIVNFAITGVAAGFTNWGGTIEVSNLTNVVQSDPSVIITITTGGDNYTFQSNNIQLYPDNNLNHNYVTWRTQNTGGSQYPTTGKSLDIWSYNLYQAISGGAQWNSLTSYDLNDVKHSLVYDYDVPFAPYYSRDGLITFTT